MSEQQTAEERVAELAKLAADFFNAMPLQAVNKVDPKLAEKFGQLMIENGYRVAFNRWYLQEAPKPIEEIPK